MAETSVSEYDFSNAEFATNMYKILKKSEGNLFFSPYSLQVVLAMAYTGSGGTTATEFQKAMSFPADKKVLEEGAKKLLTSLQASKNVELNTANAMFLQNDYTVKSEFSKNIVDFFNSDVTKVDFGQNAESAKVINDYVSKHTKGKIPELFSSDAFNSMTKLVLVNAIYFKGSWLHKFDETLTHKGDFHINSNSTVQVDYMTIKKKFFYNKDENLKASIVELKYQGDMSMILIVPDEVEGIKQVEEKLTTMDLKKIRDEMSSREVQLTMPKFKLEQSMSLKTSLAQLGLAEMFQAGKADFSGISDGKELYVSDAVQKAFIEVNEQGSEAAAATGIDIAMRMMPLPAVQLLMNRPFSFYIVQEEGPVLFMGRLSKP